MPRPKKNKNSAVVAAPDTPSAQLFSEMPKSSKLNKANLLEDSDDEGDAPADAPAFTVNEEFAKRFEYNKKREEIQRCMLRRRPLHTCAVLTAAASGGKVQEAGRV